MKRKMPFIPFTKRERDFRAFLVKYTGYDARRIRREEQEDNYYLVHDLTFTGLQEIFDAGWDAAERAIEKG